MLIKSPLRYPWWKSRAIKAISLLVPNFEEFREPFLWWGSVFLYLKQVFPNRRYWGNDIYLELYSFWEMAQNNIEEMVQLIYKWRNDFPVWKDLYRFLNSNLDWFNVLERWAAFFIYNRITFSGTSLSGWYSEWAFTWRFTESSIKRLIELWTILNDCEITNYDYEEVVMAEWENVFIFLDPPYHSATKSALYGKNGNLHKWFDHEHFAEVMKTCKHKWLITYDDSEYIRNLFSFANITAWDLTYWMRNVKKDSNQIGKELFISNYTL